MKKDGNDHKQNSDTINYKGLDYTRGLVTFPSHISISRVNHNDVRRNIPAEPGWRNRNVDMNESSANDLNEGKSFSHHDLSHPTTAGTTKGQFLTISCKPTKGTVPLGIFWLYYFFLLSEMHKIVSEELLKSARKTQSVEE